VVLEIKVVVGKRHHFRKPVAIRDSYAVSLPMRENAGSHGRAARKTVADFLNFRPISEC
jgi:hypothetical protein